MNFNQFNLNSRLEAGIKKAGYSEPTPIQKEVITLAMSGQDLIGTAQTGTGKTAAFVLPILHKLLVDQHKYATVLIVTPNHDPDRLKTENLDRGKWDRTCLSN